MNNDILVDSILDDEDPPFTISGEDKQYLDTCIDCGLPGGVHDLNCSSLPSLWDDETAKKVARESK